MTLVLFILGIVLLLGGGELLVRGASRLAVSLGISPLIVGLTVVAFSTSAPELAVTLKSVFAGKADIALGNVVGSNISNVLLILGASAVLMPVVVSQKILRIDVPLMIGVSVLLFVLALDGQISRLEGILLFAGIVAYTVFAIRQGRRAEPDVEKEYEKEYGGSREKSKYRWLLDLVAIGTGVVMLVVGSGWLVDAAVAVAKAMGLSELIIGLTIVAVGTSLPEFATSIIAIRKKESDIAVGNVVGSNIFNILSVMGLTAMIAPEGVAVSKAALYFDIPIMIMVSVACLPIFFTGHQISRWEGVLFAAYYILYVIHLIMKATAHASLSLFNRAILWFAIPLTVITLIIYCWRSLQNRNKLKDAPKGADKQP